jgi:DNA-binding GntR family transcriptional regulator
LLRDAAHQVILDAIVRGDLAPGSVVRAADLAERLGLSRAPVREAFARLADEGLIETKPQSHTRVTPLLSHVVRDAAAVVRAMHELAARTGVTKISAAGVATMTDANHRFAAAARSGDVDAAMQADDELHDVLVQASGNRAAAATIERYTPLIRRLERRRFTIESGLRSVELHNRLIEACRTADTDAALQTTTKIWHELEDLAEN